MGRRIVPHPIPYQGSKRGIAPAIMELIPDGTDRVVEPFAGSAAVTLAARYVGKARRALVADCNEPLMRLWQEILDRPEQLADGYAELWHDQLGREREYYDAVRREFNRTGAPRLLLYLLARCVKGAVRYNAAGEFNQSPDNRRRGTRPVTMRASILGANRLLAGVTETRMADYRDVLALAGSRDVVYLDPPYQGVSGTRDQRYLRGIDYEEFCEALSWLNDREVAYVLSYDGRRAGTTYGVALPERLRLRRLEVDAGRSSQATLLGRDERTYEALYVSPALARRRWPTGAGPPALGRRAMGG